MADSKKQPGRSSDSSLEILQQEFEQETASKESEKKRKRILREEDTTERTSDIKRDVLERDVLGQDAETAKEILSIDESKEYKEQKEAVRMLNLACATIVAKAIKMGVDPKERAKEFKDILALKKHPSIRAAFEKKLTQTEKVALNKLLDIANSPGTPLYEYYSKNWNGLLDNFSKSYAHAEAATEAFEGFGKPAVIAGGTAIAAGKLSAKPKKSADSTTKKSKKEEPAEDPSTWEKTKGTVTTFVKNHPYLSVGIALLGAIGIYKVFKKVKSAVTDDDEEAPTEKKEKTGFWGKLFGAGILTAVGLFIAGAIAGPEKVKEWWEKIKGAVPGAVSEADKSQAKILSEKIGQGVSPETVKAIGDSSYMDYVSITREYKDKLKDQVPFCGRSEKQIAEEKLIRKYLEDKKTEISKLGLPVSATIMQVLEALHKADTTKPGEEKPKEGQEKKDNPPGVTEAADTEDGVVAGDKESADKIKLELKNHPAVLGFIDKYKDNITEGALSPGVMASDLMEACKKDGVLTCVSGATVLLWNGAKWVAMFSWKPLAQAVIDVGQLHFGDAVTNYSSAALPLILIGAGLGAAKGLFSSKSILVESLKGAGRGFIFPIELAKIQVRAGKAVYRYGKEAEFKIQRWTSAAEAVPEILENETKFYGEMASKFDKELQQRGSYGFAEKARQKLKSPFRIHSNENLEKLRNTYYEKFEKSYEKLTGKKINLFKIEGGVKKPRDEGVEEMRKFLEERSAGGKGSAHTPEGVAQAFKEHEAILKNPDGTFKPHTELEAKKTALKTEIDALLDTDPLKRTKIQEMNAIEAYLNPTKAAAIIDGPGLSKLSETERAAKIESAAAELESAERSVQARVTKEVQAIKAEAAAKGLKLTDPEIMGKLEKVDKDVLIPFAKQKQASVKTLLEQYESLPTKMRTTGVKRQLTRVLEGTESSLSTKLSKGVKGRAKMMVLMASLMFATDQIIHRNDTDRDFSQMMAELGPDFGQLLVDVLPFVGTFSNYYSAFSGREIVTKKDVSGTWDRTSNVIWGTVGLAGDALTVLSAIPSGGSSIGANAVLRLTKAAKGGSGVAAKTLKMWPKIERIAERMGGWRKFADKVSKFNTIEKRGSKVIKGLRTVQTVGMVAGTGMLATGLYVNLRYAFVDNDTEIDIPKDLPVGEKAFIKDQSVQEKSPEQEAA